LTFVPIYILNDERINAIW